MRSANRSTATDEATLVAASRGEGIGAFGRILEHDVTPAEDPSESDLCSSRRHRKSLSPTRHAIARCAAMLILVASFSGCGAAESGHSWPSPSCSGESEDSVVEVLAKLGVSGTSTFFPRGELQDQYLRTPGALCPNAAIKLAVDAILTDRGPESLAIVAAELAPGECNAECYFRRRSSLFGIVADGASPIANQLLPAAPDGASLRDSWVFFLSVTDLSEHGYWALVARDGSSVRVRSVN